MEDNEDMHGMLSFALQHSFQPSATPALLTTQDLVLLIWHFLQMLPWTFSQAHYAPFLLAVLPAHDSPQSPACLSHFTL